MKEPLQEKIEYFLTGKMPPKEAHDFLDEISGDPQLMEEVDLQRKVIRGLKEYRYHQLKATLNAIPVSTAPWYGVLQTGVYKLVGGVAITATLGIGAYSYLKNDSETDIAKDYIEKVDYPKNIRTFEWQIPEMEISQAEVIRQEETTNKKDDLPPKEKPQKTNSIQPSVIVPDVPVLDQNLDDQNTFYADMPEVPRAGADTESAEPLLDVQVNAISSDTELSYRFFDGKLSLYGDFGGNSYQILEIYTATGKQLYLKYKGKYFEIQAGSAIQPLKAISDQEKISKIRILELKN